MWQIWITDICIRTCETTDTTPGVRVRDDVSTDGLVAPPLGHPAASRKPQAEAQC